MKNKKGFTLVELLAVIVVLAIVMLVVADRVGDAMLKSRGNSLALQVKSLNREVEKVGAMENQITTEQIDKIVSSGDLTYLGTIPAGTNGFNNDVIVVQAQKGSKFANITSTKDIEELGTLVKEFDGKNIAKDDGTLNTNKTWLREPIIYFETTVPIVFPKAYKAGTEILIGIEKFNVIKDNGNSITMLAQHNLTKDGLTQTISTDNNEYGVAFAKQIPDKKPDFNYAYWTDDNGDLLLEYGSTYPANVYNKAPKTNLNLLDNNEIVKMVNNYVNKLKGIKSINDKTSLTGRLIYESELLELGYPTTGFVNCANKENEVWLTNGQNWWSGSAYSNNSVYFVNFVGQRGYNGFWDKSNGVRPVITISKSAL